MNTGSLQICGFACIIGLYASAKLITVGLASKSGIINNFAIGNLLNSSTFVIIFVLLVNESINSNSTTDNVFVSFELILSICLDDCNCNPDNPDNAGTGLIDLFDSSI